MSEMYLHYQRMSMILRVRLERLGDRATQLDKMAYHHALQRKAVFHHSHLTAGKRRRNAILMLQAEPEKQYLEASACELVLNEKSLFASKWRK